MPVLIERAEKLFEGFLRYIFGIASIRKVKAAVF